MYGGYGGMAKANTRQAEKRRLPRDDASLYPLDPETAIRAIMEAGPHPKELIVATVPVVWTGSGEE